MNTQMKLAAAAVLLATLSAQAQLNPGFEDGVGGDADNWFQSAFGGPGALAERTNNVFRSGDWSMLLAVDGITGAGTRAFAEQSGLPVFGGFEVEFSIYGRIADPLGPGVVSSVFINFFDGGGAFIGTAGVGIGGSLNNDWQLFSVATIAPATAVTALVGIDVVGGAFPESDGVAFFDDASFVAVPAPTGVAALGLAGLVATRRRRA